MDAKLIATPLKIGVSAFFVGLVAVVFAFFIDYQADNILAYVFFWLVASAVLVGFISVVWGAWLILRSGRQNKERNNA